MTTPSVTCATQVFCRENPCTGSWSTVTSPSAKSHVLRYGNSHLVVFDHTAYSFGYGPFCFITEAP